MDTTNPCGEIVLDSKSRGLTTLENVLFDMSSINHIKNEYIEAWQEFWHPKPFIPTKPSKEYRDINEDWEPSLKF